MWDLQRGAELGTGCRTALPAAGGFVLFGVPGEQVTHRDRPSERPAPAPPVRQGVWEAELSSQLCHRLPGDLEQLT